MSEIIHSKATAETFLQKTIGKAGVEDIPALAKAVNSELLSQKIKFPALEYCAKVLYNSLPNDLHFLFNKGLIKNK